MTAALILSLSVNALLAFTLCWLVTRRRPSTPRPQTVRPLGPAKPYQRGAAWVPCGDPTSTERIRRIRDHSPRLARRPM